MLVIGVVEVEEVEVSNKWRELSWAVVRRRLRVVGEKLEALSGALWVKLVTG